MSAAGIILLFTVVGLLLIAIDFYLPAFILGTIGCVFLLIAVGFCFSQYGFVTASVAFIVEVILGISAGWFTISYGAKSGVGGKMVLNSKQIGTTDTNPTRQLVGRIGIAESLLRPSGIATLDGKRLDVVAETGTIESGSQIRVVSVEGTQIIVRKT